MTAADPARTPPPALTREEREEALEMARDWSDPLTKTIADRSTCYTLARGFLDSERRYAEARADTERLDWLEKEAHIEPLALHDGRSGSFGIRGLGLMPGNVRRTLREAIDAARSEGTTDG